MNPEEIKKNFQKTSKALDSAKPVIIGMLKIGKELKSKNSPKIKLNKINIIFHKVSKTAYKDLNK